MLLLLLNRGTAGLDCQCTFVEEYTGSLRPLGVNPG